MPTGIYKRTPLMKTGKHMKDKIPWNKGKTGIYTDEIKKKIGRNNPNYKGGITLGENRKEYCKRQNKDYKLRLRNSVLEIMGGKCVRCGFSDKRALQIDHIKGGGNRERKEKRFLGMGTSYYKYVMESFLKNENRYQLLCANCNWIKRFENNEVKGNYLINGEK